MFCKYLILSDFLWHLCYFHHHCWVFEGCVMAGIYLYYFMWSTFWLDATNSKTESSKVFWPSFSCWNCQSCRISMQHLHYLVLRLRMTKINATKFVDQGSRADNTKILTAVDKIKNLLTFIAFMQKLCCQALLYELMKLNFW